MRGGDLSGMDHPVDLRPPVGALDEPRLLFKRARAVPRFAGQGTPRIELYRPGNLDDFDRLYRATYSRILFTLSGVLRDRTAAEDCVQETFVRALRAWPRWRPEARAEVWLYTIALNVATSYQRREGRRGIREVLRVFGRPAGADAEDEVAGPAPRGDVLAALRRLPRDQAAAVVLRHHHGYSNREIGAALGVPESTISSRLAAGKQRLIVELTRNGAEAPSGEEEPLAGAAARSA